ncbi:translation termination factor GTPase eRF3 [Saccharomycopsis crataegensis]|uniref:Elongation factor 1 alpha-like protein n=1 Tax=Saccharomycopsis crataegensis TaxID=43959 RepID=A0AAV5QNT6_9ASCO|nr:translation termination factor GTPase eRF3 [Saccharomycopsis crataegensis]
MSDNNDNVNNLANQFADQNLGDASQGQDQGQFNPGQAQAFNPAGGQQQQYYGNNNNYYQQGYNNYNQGYNANNYNQGYNQGYNNNYRNNYNNKGYNNYNNNNNNNNNYNQGYNNYNQGYNNYNQGYNGYNANNTNTNSQSKGMTLDDYKKQQASTTAAKPKKTLKLTSSSGIKLANAPKKEQPKKEEPKEEKKEEKKEEPKKDEVKEEPKEEKKEEPKKEEVKEEPAPVKKVEKKAAPAAAATPEPKEEETYIDPEVEKDLFDRKETMSVIFMGHVDAGKSTLSGNILFLSGSVDKRTVEKYEREAKDASRQGWYLSWIMDTNKEERNEGKTVETGKAYFETEKRKYTILDAPGHKMYVSEMIGGASQADVGILVISARKGEFEAGFEKSGQTKEHAMLAKVQGVERLVVVINKLDDESVNWSEKRYKECVTKLSLYLKGIGFDLKKNVYFLPVSGFTGAGLKDRVTNLKYYKGPSLLEYLDGLETINRSVNAPFMLPISGKMKDLGTVVEGKIASGHVKKNDTLLIMPNRVSVEVMNIYTETEAENEMAKSGEQVRLKIRGIEEEEVSPGYVVTSPKAPVKIATRFEAQIAIVELKSILSTGFSCVMHVHTAIEEVTFTALLHKLQKGTNRKSKHPPPFAKKGMKIIAVLETTQPICIESYDDYPQLGRFTLRDQGATIAIGKITKLLN